MGEVDFDLLDMIAQELAAQPPMEVVWKPESVLQFVSMIQLAMRHPSIADYPENVSTAQRFLQATRQYFAECPMTLELIRRGDDPEYDE
jgi:hypothetical protein